MSILTSIRYNLANLTSFTGRETRSQFWPYAAFIVILSMIGMAAVMPPEMAASMERMQRFASEHPELATVQSSPGSYSIRIEGHHPELMPNMGSIMMGMGIVFVAAILLLAAAVTRRLHDRGKSGRWGFLPIPFILFASIMMPRVFAQSQPDLGLFFAIFINNLLYIASLIFLVVLLAGASAKDDNRFGTSAAT